MHTPLWSKVFIEIPHHEISQLMVDGNKKARRISRRAFLILDYLSATTLTETFAITL
jgi:hypothetical protein